MSKASARATNGLSGHPIFPYSPDFSVAGVVFYLIPAARDAILAHNERFVASQGPGETGVS